MKLLFKLNKLKNSIVLNHLLFAFFLLFTSFCSAAQQATSAPELPEPLLKSLRQLKIPTDALSVVVRKIGSPTTSGQSVVSYRATQVRQPASTLKIITTGATLESLGAAYRWKTRVFTTGAIDNGTLNGDLILVGAGDPKFNYEDLNALIQRIRTQGITQINGKIIFDRSLFSKVPQTDIFDGEALRTYNVPPDALLVSQHSVLLHLMPDEASKTARVWLEPPILIPHTKTVAIKKGRCEAWKDRLKPSFNADGLWLNGTYPSDCTNTFWSVYPSWLSPDQYLAQLFNVLWQTQGGSALANFANGAVPNNARLFTEWESEPLAHIVELTNKFSNNTMAQHLLLTLGAETYHTNQVGFEAGKQAVFNWLSRNQIDHHTLTIENGSGLSRVETASAQLLADVLEHLWFGHYQPEFFSSLPILGIDGTLASRLQNPDLIGKARLKTGLLNDVRALAGVIQSRSQQWYIVVMLVNHDKAKASVSAQQALLQWVYDLPPGQ